MTTQLTNIKFDLFKEKEHYLAFRQAWKDYINSGNHKPDYVPCLNGGMEKVSNLNSSQQLLFCIFTEKDLSIVFKKSENPKKPNGFMKAYSDLMYMLRIANSVCQNEQGAEPPSYIPKESKERYDKVCASYKETLDIFLKPFGKAVTYYTLEQLKFKLDNNRLSNEPINKKEAA